MPARKRRPPRGDHDAAAAPSVALLQLGGKNRDGDILATYAKGQVSGILLPSPAKRGAWRDLGRLRSGDVVLARLLWNKRKDHFTARIIRKLPGERQRLLGRFRREGKSGTGFLEPVNKRDRNRYLVPAAHAGNAQDGDLVDAERLPNDRRRHRQAKVTTSHGRLDLSRGLSLIAAHEQGLPLSFSPEAIQEVDALRPVTFDGSGADDANARVDLRHFPFVTIDPESARDHDDAVWAQPDGDGSNPGGWIVFVAIADVAAYVNVGGALDRDARERGNSTYFPDGVLPMLPERLSSDLCSLRAGEERPCMAVRLVIDGNGRTRSHSFFRAMMKSAATLSYEQAQAAIDGAPDSACRPLLQSSLTPLWGAYRALQQERMRRQPLELALPEYRVMVGAEATKTAFAAVPRVDAHRLIEEFMIAANHAVARELSGRLLIHRVHEPPAPEKTEQLREFLRSLTPQIRMQPSPRPKDFNGILQRIDSEDLQAILGEAVLRSQNQAFYGVEALGHFGLQLRHYAHFTSPIRRYADLTVHRVLIGHLQRKAGGLPRKDRDALRETAAHISETERRSVSAERDTVDRYLAAWYCGHIGARMEGRIVGVTKSGLFIRPQGSPANGFAPVARLPGRYFRFDPARQAMVERASPARVFHVGDAVKIEIAEANTLTGGLIFDVLPERGKRKRR